MSTTTMASLRCFLFFSFLSSLAHGWLSSSSCSSSRLNPLLSSPSVMDGVYTLDDQEIRGPITPLGNFVLVKTKDAITATGGGIFLPDQSQERPTEGIVLAAGPGKLHPHTGVRITNPVQEGMSVLFGKFDGLSIKYNTESCQVVRDDDIMLYYTDGVTMTLDNVVPCRDYVLIELEEDLTETKSGIVVAAAVQSSQLPCEGTVVKVGEGRMASEGEIMKSPVAEGDVVKFKDYGGNDVFIENKHYSLVRMVDILCTTQVAGAAVP